MSEGPAAWLAGIRGILGQARREQLDAERRARLAALGRGAPLSVLVDVGAAGGLQSSWKEANQYVPLECFLLDPQPGTMPASGICLPYALADRDGEAVLYRTAHPECSSLRQPDLGVLSRYAVRQWFEVVETLNVRCHRYDTLVALGQAPPPHFLKVDTQGFEYEVLEGFGSVLEEVVGLELEGHFYPLYRGQRLVGDLVRLLRAKGMVLCGLRPHGPFEGDLVEANLYFRRLPESLSPDDCLRLRIWLEVCGVGRGVTASQVAGHFS